MSVSQELPEEPLWAYLQYSREYTGYLREVPVKYAIRIGLDKHLTTAIKRIRLVIMTFEELPDLVWCSFLPSEIGANPLASDSKPEELHIHFRFEPEWAYSSRIINESLSLCNRARLKVHSPPTYARILHNKVYELSASNPIVLITLELATIPANNFTRQLYPNTYTTNHYFIYIAKSHGFFDSRHWFPTLPINVIADIARYCLLLNNRADHILWASNPLRSDVKIITNLSLISKQWTKEDILKDVLFSRIMTLPSRRLDREELTFAVKLLRERPSRGRGIKSVTVPISYEIQDPKIDGGKSREKLLEEFRKLYGYFTDLDCVRVFHPVFAVARKEIEKLTKVKRFHVTRGHPKDWWGVNDCIVEDVLETINGWELLASVTLEGKYKYTVGDPTEVPNKLPAYRPQDLTLYRLHISDLQIRHLVSNPLQRLESLTLYGVRGLTTRGLREVFQLIADCLRELSIRKCYFSSERDETLGNSSENFQERPLDSTISFMPTILNVNVPYEVASDLSIARKREGEPDHTRKTCIKITDYKIPDRQQYMYPRGQIGLPEALLKTGWKEITVCFWSRGKVLDRRERSYRKNIVQLARKAADHRGVAFRAP